MNTPRKRNSKKSLSNLAEGSWKWMAGASALTVGAAATSVSGRTVQITLVNEQLTNGNNSLTGDFTRDGVADAPLWNGVYSTQASNVSVYLSNTSRRVASAGWIDGVSSGFSAGVNGIRTINRPNPTSVKGLIPFTFRDVRINGGVTTAAFVDVRAFNTGPVSHTIQLLRSVFSDSSTLLPTGVVAGRSNREFDATIYAQRTSLKSKIKKTKKKHRKSKKSGDTVRADTLKNKIKRLNRKLAAIA